MEYVLFYAMAAMPLTAWLLSVILMVNCKSNNVWRKLGFVYLLSVTSVLTVIVWNALEII